MITHPESLVDEATESYEAPQIESVLTPEELDREVFYAGAPITGIGGGGA